LVASEEIANDLLERLLLAQPTEQQLRFIDAREREQLYGGAKRGGKTVAGCLKAILLSVMIPGNRGMIARQHWPELRDSTLETFRRICPSELIIEWRQTDKIMQLRSEDERYPSTILFRALGEKEDIEKAKGVDLGWLWIDEPSEVPEQTYLMLLAQMNWQLPGGSRPPYMAMLTSNPEPGWVKRRFIDKRPRDFVFIPALPRDNPHLPEGWEDELRAGMPGDWIEKYLNGSWNVGEGSVFKELDEGRHALEDVDSKGLKLVSAIDHASTGVTCCLEVGIDADENIYALEEYYERNRLISEHAAAIASMLRRWESREAGPPFPKPGNPPKADAYGKQEYTLIDPSTEAKTLQGPYELYSVQEEYRRQGIPTVAGFRANIDVGINLVNEYLHVSPLHRHPRTQAMGAPRLYIQKSKCPNLWRELSELRRDLLPSGKPEYIGDDHAVDCLRYIVMSRPAAPKRQALDQAKLPPQEQKVIRSHEKWARAWDRKVKPNRWY